MTPHPMTAETATIELPVLNIRTIKEDICPSLSTKSTLAYQIGSTSDSQILMRIDKNTGNGIFSREWVRLDTIIAALKKSKEPFTWDVLCPLFEKQSVNTAGFLMAGLKHVGLVQQTERRYVMSDPSVYMPEMKKLIKKKTPRKARETSTKSRSAA